VPTAPSGWTTLFSDDFTGASGTGLNTSNWLYDTGTGYSGGASNWGTGEIESATTSTANVYQDGSGHLAIKPIRDSAGNWTSGRVETQRTDFAAPAGGELEITASLQLPNPTVGSGYWPAFWALGNVARTNGATTWPKIGELDMMESVNGLSEVSHTFHCGVDPNGPCNETTGIGSGLLSVSGAKTGFHTYSVIVDRTNTSAEQLRFYIDGANTFSVNESQVDTTTWANAVDHGFFPILNVAMGGSYPNNQCGCTTPASNTTSGAPMLVDYVAVYQKPAASSSTGSTQCTTTATANISADCYNATSGTVTTATATGDTSPSGVDGNQVSQLGNGTWLQYNNINFGTTGSTQFQAQVASGAASGVSGEVEAVLDNVNNSPVATFSVGNTGGWSTWKNIPFNMTKTTGTHTVYLKFVSTASGNPPFASLHYFSFPTS
jgi:hypothetical protein